MGCVNLDLILGAAMSKVEGSAPDKMTKKVNTGLIETTLANKKNHINSLCEIILTHKGVEYDDQCVVSDKVT